MKNKLFILLFFLPFYVLSQTGNMKMSFKNRIKSGNPPKTLSFPITENQRNYDVKYYKLQIEIDTANNSFTGRAEIAMEVLRNPVKNIQLDFVTNHPFNGKRLNSIESVWLNNESASYSHYDSTLDINLSREYQVGEKIGITVFWENSADGYYFNFLNVQGTKMILTLDEPFGARFWFPCKDYPEDKADSTDMIVTVPKNYIVASNGSLIEKSENENNVTYHWHESYPIATYLMSISAFPYKTHTYFFRYGEADSMAINYFYLPKSESTVKSTLDLIPNALKIFSDLFGLYPFIKEKYAEAEMYLLPGGMENQNCTSIQGWNKWVRVHELSHSWWGNMMTCKNFHHIWLQEGAATYFATLYFKLAGDKAEYDYWMNWAKYTGPGTIYRDDVTDDFNLFHGNLVYQKASRVFHMLRFVGGDSLFFKAFRELYSDKRYKYNVIDTEEFMEFFEKIYNMDLEWFFQQWIYEENCPDYNLKWFKYNWGEKTNIKLVISQPKDRNFFKMPADITFKTSYGDTTFRIWDSLQVQTFNFTVNGKVDSMFFDKEDWILKTSRNVVEVNSMEVTGEYDLSQNYPNPFNSITKISFSIKEPGKTTLIIYDLLGREVRTLKNEYLLAGKYSIDFDAKYFASGIYFYKLQSNNFQSIKRLVLLK